MAAAITREQVLESLRSLKEPVFDKSMVDLNLIRDIMIREGSISLTMVINEDSASLKDSLRQTVVDELGVLEPNSVHVRFRTLTDHEKSSLSSQLKPSDNEDQPAAQRTRTQKEIQAAGVPPLLSPGSQTHFIAIASGKGGVGKSTVTVNLAVALARKGKKVGIIDADIYGFSIPDMMGIEERPKMDDNRIIPVERHGVKVMSMGFFVEDNAPVIWRGPMLGKMLRNFFSEVSWGEVEYLLLDLPPGTGDVALDVHQMIPHSKEIVVTTPHATASFVAARAGSMALRTDHEILGVVENMAYYQCGSCGNKEYVFGRGGGAKLAETLHTELLAQIPLGAPDQESILTLDAPSVYTEDSETGKLYLEMAEKVIGKIG